MSRILGKCDTLRGRVINNLDNPHILLEEELSFLHVHLLKSFNLYEG